jgi:lipopolysaccharide/colanic/teichoic acid biosynthesis glycosyltransferase
MTRVGRWLRRARLDEVPQLFNVLRGEMSLVGPRPERPAFVEALSHALPAYPLRHTVKPGITGWAQVQYRYGNTSADAGVKLEYDLYYLVHRSPGLDAQILLRTVEQVLWLRGV